MYVVSNLTPKMPQLLLINIMWAMTQTVLKKIRLLLLPKSRLVKGTTGYFSPISR